MLPFKVDVPTRSFPAVVVALIAVNVVIYLYEFFLWFDPATAGRPSLGGKLYGQFVVEFGLIPCRVGDICPPRLDTALAGAPAPTLTVLTSMFVHGGLLHVGGNMLYLWIFGGNVEDSDGARALPRLDLVSGSRPRPRSTCSTRRSALPMVGASGAVSGTLGAYLVLYPNARVWTLVIFGFFVRVIRGARPGRARLLDRPPGALGVLPFGGAVPKGVVFLAHVGGFLAGLALIGLFRRPRSAPGYGWA